MVTTGAVLMVTPLHPVGHAMAIGGVVVLGRLRQNGKKEEKVDDSTKATDVGDELSCLPSDKEEFPASPPSDQEKLQTEGITVTLND